MRVEERPTAESVPVRHAAEEHHRERDQQLGQRRMRVFVDAQILQILFAGAREVDLVEDLVGRTPIADERQDEVADAERRRHAT